MTAGSARMQVNFLLQADASHPAPPSTTSSWSDRSDLSAPAPASAPANPHIRAAPPPSAPPAPIAMMELANAAALASAAQRHHPQDVPFSPVSTNSRYSVEERIDRIPAPSKPHLPAPHLPALTNHSSQSPPEPAPASSQPSSSRTHLCNHCGESFSLKVRFLHHLLTVHNMRTYDTRTILPCAKCNSAFLRNTDRSKHDLCVHQRLRPFRCDAKNCSSSFFFSKDLIKHRSTVHLRHKPFLCSICPKAFGKREHMTSHVKRVHQKLRPFKCVVCDICLASKYNLQGHLKTAAHAAAETLAKRDSSRTQSVRRPS